MKVLIADSLSPQAVTILKESGHEVIDGKGLTGRGLLDAVSTCEALIVRSATQVVAEVIDAGAKLIVIGRAGAGVDNIDVDAATRRGIIVMNTPEGNTIAAAELTMAMMLALSRKIPQAHASVLKGEWERKSFQGTELRDKTLGIIGIGRIGRAVARRAAAFGMKIVAYDPFISPDAASALDVEMIDFDTVLDAADYITLHTPLTNETRGMIGREQISKMKRGVRLINCARGGIIDEAAAAEAIRSGHVAGCAVDVYSEEPPRDNPLIGLENVICTPHLGALTDEAQQSVAEQVARQVSEVLAGKPPRNAVNLPMLEPETLAELLPYARLAEKMGRAVVQLWDQPIRDVRVQYQGEFTSNPLQFVTASLLQGMLSILMDSAVNTVNAPVIARERGVRVSEVTRPQAEDYANTITAEIVNSGKPFIIEGSFLGLNDPRIVRLNNYRVELVPEGHILVCTNRDVPGAISYISTILANRNVNIANMTVGRDVRGGTAATVINLDCALPPEIVEAIRSSPIIIDAKVIKL